MTILKNIQVLSKLLLMTSLCIDSNNPNLLDLFGSLKKQSSLTGVYPRTNTSRSLANCQMIQRT